jgi:hypothetical protein
MMTIMRDCWTSSVRTSSVQASMFAHALHYLVSNLFHQYKKIKLPPTSKAQCQYAHKVCIMSFFPLSRQQNENTEAARALGLLSRAFWSSHLVLSGAPWPYVYAFVSRSVHR